MKRIVALALVLIMALGCVGCGSKTEEPTPTPTPDSVFPYTFTDYAGREVTITEPVDALVTPYSVAITFISALGKSDVIVGKDVGSDSNILLKSIAPNLANVPSIGNSGQVDLELILTLKPDVFVNRARNVGVLDDVQKAGVTSIGLNPETPEQVLETYDLFATLLGCQDRAEVLKKAYKDIVDKAAALVKDLPEEKRVTAIMMGSEIGKIANGEMLQSNMIQLAGAKNPAIEIETNELWPVVGVEQIFEWDPEYIFLTSYGKRAYSVDDLKNDPAWANLKAIKNDRVLVTPCELESWEIPGPHSCLSSLWMVSVLYPEIYSDADFEKDVIDYFKILYPETEITREMLGF